MRHKPKANAKRTRASNEAGKARAGRGAVRAKSKTAAQELRGSAKTSAKETAVKSRLKRAKTVVAAVKSPTVAKATKSKTKAAAAPATARAEAPRGRKAPATAKPPRAVISSVRSLAVKTRKPKTPLSAAKQAKFALGQVVKHRIYAFRGVVFDIDPVFSNTEDWWLAIPAEVRPKKDQPFYHLLAENEETEYIAYVSEQNLIADTSGQPLRHPQLSELFVEDDEGRLRAVFMQPN